ncbi:MAG: sensor histidine kinase [Bacteroidales bacterium]|nr:sensor histidine kinase [Bacteroidales bacterium]
MNVDTLLHQYFSSAGNICIEMFDEKNIQQVYRRLVEVLIHQPEVETSLLQGMSYCFYEVMDNVLIHSGKTVGIVITNYSEEQHLIQILVADDGMGIRESLAQNSEYANVSEPQALEYCIRDKVSDGKGMGFGLYSTSRLINTAGHKLIIRSGSHTLTANGDVVVSETDYWRGTIVYFELRSNMDIDSSAVVDHRTDPAEEFEDLFLGDNPELENLW